MKKFLALAIVFSLAFVLTGVSFAQVEAPVPVDAVVEGEVVVEEGTELGVVDACGPVVMSAPCGPYRAPCRPFFRRHCPPAYGDACYGTPCPPQPCYDACAPAPRCFPRRAWAACPAPCPTPCPVPCADPCMGPCGDPCGYPAPCFRPAPVRNFFRCLFGPRPYCGYDAFYGPAPYGCDPCF